MIADGKELADNKTIYINQNTRLSWYDGILGSKIVPYAPQRKPVPKWISMPIVTSIYNHTIT